MRIAALACPQCHKELQGQGNALHCRVCGSYYPVVQGIASLLLAPRSSWEALIHTLDRDMRRHPWVVLKMSVASCSWLPRAREHLLQSLPLHPGDLVLDHCTGRGGNLAGLRQAVGESGGVAAFDLSRYGLDCAFRLIQKRGWQNVRVHQADAHHLPYLSEAFDAVVHFGAWNQLACPERALEEILRVTRANGWVVLLDEGIEPTRRGTLWGALLQWGNPLFRSKPPLKLLRSFGISPEVRWVMRGMFYEVRFRRPA